MDPVQFGLVVAACLAALCLGYIFAALRLERKLAPRGLVSKRTAGFFLPRFLLNDERPGPGE